MSDVPEARIKELARTLRNPNRGQVEELLRKVWAEASSTRSESERILPPADANGKRPRLFYWEDAEDCWCPAEGLLVENIIGTDQFFSDGDVQKIRFKREDMTDAEFDAIPEG